MISTLRLATFELRRFKGVLPRIAIGFLAIVPLMYGALYLWSNWDPYGRLDQVPVAVVNEDVPVQFEGETVNAGQQFVEQLEQERIFDWQFTDAGDAADGLANGRYYLIITVPSDFSANLVSGTGTDPRRAVILLHRDDVNGYVIGMLTNSVQDKLTAAIDAAAVGTYFQAVFGNLEEIRTGLSDAATGASQLQTGLDTASQGSTDLATGLGTAKEGSASLVTGLTDAKTGSDTLVTGLDSAATGASDLATGLSTLETGSAQLVTGADQVATGTQQLADLVVPVLDTVIPLLPQITQAGSDLSTDVADLTAGTSGTTNSVASHTAEAKAALAQLAQSNPALASDAAFIAAQTAVDAVASRTTEVAVVAAELATGASQVKQAADQINAGVPNISGDLQNAAEDLTDLADGAQQVADGAADLNSGITEASSGADTLSTGITEADTGAQTLSSGLGDLSTGATQLDSGLSQLVTGAGDLQTGLSQADTGAGELADQLAAGVDRMPVISPDQRSDAVQVLSSPVDPKLTIDNPAVVYGRGLAPFFFAIAIWVFGITAFLVLRPVSGRALAGRASAVRIAVAGWLPIGILAILGSLLLLAVSWFALGLDPVHPGGAIGVVVLAAICFSAIAHLLRTWLGAVGSAITLVLLMVQLVSAGGLYPVETLPAPLRALHPAIPMTYLIDSLRVTFTGGPIPRLWADIGILAAVAAVAIGLTVLVVARRKQFGMRDLHPLLA